jgi:hypothetical protein
MGDSKRDRRKKENQIPALARFDEAGTSSQSLYAQRIREDRIIVIILLGVLSWLIGVWFFAVPDSRISTMEITTVYKDYAIIAAGRRDEKTRKYKPLVHITRHASDGRREVHSFSLPEYCDSFDKASTRALEAAKAWIDDHFVRIDHHT